jgi:hypothetical protein
MRTTIHSIRIATDRDKVIKDIINKFINPSPLAPAPPPDPFDNIRSEHHPRPGRPSSWFKQYFGYDIPGEEVESYLKDAYTKYRRDKQSLPIQTLVSLLYSSLTFLGYALTAQDHPRIRKEKIRCWNSLDPLLIKLRNSDHLIYREGAQELQELADKFGTTDNPTELRPIVNKMESQLLRL